MHWRGKWSGLPVSPESLDGRGTSPGSQNHSLAPPPRRRRRCGFGGRQAEQYPTQFSMSPDKKFVPPE
jgi:hypothetical protein